MAKTKIIESSTFQINVGLERQYKKELRKLIHGMLKETTESLSKIYSQNKEDVSFAMDSLGIDIRDKLNELSKKYDKIFKTMGLAIAQRMVMRQFRYAKSTFAKFMKDILPKDSITISSVIPMEMNQTLQATIMENVSLIKSIPPQYFNRVTGSVTRSIQSGGSIKQLKEDLAKYNGMTKRRADIIANDQSKKAFTAINMRNAQKYGIKKVEWIHSGGGQHPRNYHKIKWDGVSHNPPNGLNGYIFNLDEPPVIDLDTGERGMPAQLPNCKCVFRYVVEVDPV